MFFIQDFIIWNCIIKKAQNSKLLGNPSKVAILFLFNVATLLSLLLSNNRIFLI